jgi:hypothetical protein
MGRATAHHFNDAAEHKAHGRRIDRAEARAHNVHVEDLEDNPDLQEAVLTAYHLSTIMMENSPTAKFFRSDSGTMWIKNTAPTQLDEVAPVTPPGPPTLRPPAGGQGQRPQPKRRR